ncbi:MAG: DUF4810 domain-containing protein [Desulforhopalus sp.]|nr:DUF4810 domain-containing protein [Desulforhopalus sp.]
MEAGSLQNKMFRGMVLVGMTILLSGCAQKTIYSWGNYHQVAYNTMQQEGDPQQELTEMKEQAVKAEADGQKLPPGFHAQMGMLYAQVGNDQQMRAEFFSEKELFPESRPYMDFLLSDKKIKKETTEEEKDGK